MLDALIERLSAEGVALVQALVPVSRAIENIDFDAALSKLEAVTGRKRKMIRVALCLAILLTAGQALGRTLQEIRRSGELRICVAGTSAPFYEANGEDFARYLGVRAKTEKLTSWDQQFHNADGVTIQDAAYDPAALASGRCDVHPNDLHISAWRKQKMALILLLRNAKCHCGATGIARRFTRVRRSCRAHRGRAGRY